MTSWSVPQFPRPLRGEPTVHVVEQAMITRYTSGAIPTTEAPDLWVRGAVYGPDEQLVGASQRMRGRTGDRVAAVDPKRLPSKPAGDLLEGSWVYAGHWMRAFGHFVTETLTTLWPTREALGRPAGVVCHRWLEHPAEPLPFQHELLRLLGWDDVPLRVVTTRPLRVERLLVPDRTFVVGGWAHPQAVDVWRRVSASLTRPDSPRRVFLSRSRFNAELRAAGRPVRASPERDQALDRDFAGAGFQVVHPEALGIAEQISLVAGARVIAGAAGSALHLAAFASDPALVVEVGDERSPELPLVGQRIIDTACGHLTAFVPHDVAARQVLDQLDLDHRPPVDGH